MKVLVVVYGGGKYISLELKKFSIYHYHFQSGSSLDSLNESVINYIAKIFICENKEDNGYIKKMFPQYISYISNAGDIPELIIKLESEGYYFLSKREIAALKNTNFRYLTFTIIFAGLKDNSVSNFSIKTKLNNIIKQGIYAEKYIITKINKIYIGHNNDIISKIINFDHIITIGDDEIKDGKSRLDSLSLTKNHALISLEDLVYYWGGLYKCYSELTIDTDIIYIMDINSIEQPDLHKIIDTIYLNSAAGHQSLFMYQDKFAIGTSQIMKYYMILYQYYGMYCFKNMQRDLDIGIFTKDEYKQLDDKYSLNSRCQLFEHILSFTNVVLSKLYKVPLTINVKPRMIIVTYYGFNEQFVFIRDALVKVGFDLHGFPYFHYRDNGGEEVVIEKMKEMINEIDPQYILWWILNIPLQSFIEIYRYRCRVKHLYYNWDEPYNWDPVDSKHKSKYLYYAFITCQETTKRYLENGTKHAICLYPGFSPSFHYPMENIEYKYDISIICTNLYENQEIYPDQIIRRADIVQNIYDQQEKMGFKFAIFGGEGFRERFPKSYQGYCRYEDTCRIFNESRINLCTHVVGNKAGYLNERVFMILGSGALLFIDPVPGVDSVLRNGINCVMIDTKRYIEQIKRILSNYQYYNKIKKAAIETSKTYTWDDWGIKLRESLLDNSKCSGKK